LIIIITGEIEKRFSLTKEIYQHIYIQMHATVMYNHKFVLYASAIRCFERKKDGLTNKMV